MNLRRTIGLLLVAAALTVSARPAVAQPASPYQAEAVVTGTGEKNRRLGFAIAFQRALARVSGDPRLIGSPEAEKLAADAERFVAGFSYRDRLAGIPIHDEQGSYDRPHFLTVDFKPAEIDAALAALGSRPWRAERPAILVVLTVSRGADPRLVASDAASDADMTTALASAGAEIGLDASFAQGADIAKAGLEPGNGAQAEQLAVLAQGRGATALAGTLTWSDAAHGWVADWRLSHAGRDHAWRVEGVSFDDAFRNGVRGAAQVLSDNGEPDRFALFP